MLADLRAEESWLNEMAANSMAERRGQAKQAAASAPPISGFPTTDVSPGSKRPLLGPSCGLAQPPTQKRPDQKAEALIHAGAANYRRLAARAASPRPIRRAQQGTLWDLLVRTPNMWVARKTQLVLPIPTTSWLISA